MIMGIHEIKQNENLKKIIAPYFNTLKRDDKSELYTAQIKMLDYYELGCVITNMLKMCVLTLDQDKQKILDTNKSSINVALILEMVLEMFPLEEFELLSKINQLVITDS
ncbi:hypothetical protein [[Flexibacter] sp. ATCC 35103]|uniref:hypothetical protein n=1 Tax=[Flexibacter] sp. ATCC 35103 TaxID=1937528 RepID=UPI0021009A5A|nr:hypothetical protein [[Flexibacter] sp. ATCC 35103]